ncbi:MAG TPA: glycosyltransferase [Solirubrobacteraceae bacterium]|jgi:glycosyltransferase involved in cell wall biosynthesis
MRRLRWITPIPPCFDAGGGGEIRQAELLAALADRFEVDLLTAGPLTDDRLRSRLSSVTEVDVVPYVDPSGLTRRRLRDVRWQLLERRPDEVARHVGTRRALTRALGEVPPADIVCVEYISLAPLLPRRRSEPWTLTLHNLTSAMARHNAALAPGRRQRVMLAQEERNSRHLEHWAARAYDLVVTPSPKDARMLPGRVSVIPNGVDSERFRPSPLPSEPRVVFTGALHTLPNRDGIVWFCSEIWPRIRAQLPEARLDIVGSRPPRNVASLDQLAGVAVHADVPAVPPFLDRARVVVVPLRIGSGSRLKVLEALAAGRPTVGTTIGVEGLEAVSGRHLLVEDQPEAFARAVVMLLGDDDRAQALAQAGRELIDVSYAWPRIGRQYADLLEGLLTPDAGPAPRAAPRPTG